MGPTPIPPPTPPTTRPPSPSRPPLIPNENDDDDNNNDDDGNHISLAQLKALVRKKLRESGAIDDILGQLRGHLLRPLARTNFQEDQQAHTRSGMSLESMVLNSIVVDFLRHQQLRQTLAVFLPESRMLIQQHVLSRHDLVQTLMLAQSEDKDERRSLLHALVLPFRRAKQSSVPSSSSSHTQTQTEAANTTLLTPPLHHHHHHEERLRLFQQECEARAQKELAAEMAHFRETELTHLRLEEAAKHRRELLIIREEMQATQDRKVEQAWTQAKEEERRVHARLQAGEAAQFEARQAVLHDIEAMRRREEEVERAEARAAERLAGLDKEQQALKEQAVAWARQRAGEVAAAHQEGAKAYASQLQSLQVQQRFLQEELRKVQAERVVCQEQGAEVWMLRRGVEEARGCVEEVEGLRKEKERWVLEKGRLQKQEEEAWTREQEATAMVRDLERTCGGLENENERMRQQAGEDEMELEGLREEVRTLRDLLMTSRKALDCLGARAGGRPVVEAQQGQSQTVSFPSLPLSCASTPPQSSSLPSSVPTSSPMTMPMPVVRPPPSPLRRQVGGGYPYPPPSTFSSSPFLSPSCSFSSTAIDSAMRAYETEVQKLKDEFLLLRQGGGGGGNGDDAAVVTAAGVVKRQSEKGGEEEVEEEEGEEEEKQGEVESQQGEEGEKEGEAEET